MRSPTGSSCTPTTRTGPSTASRRPAAGNNAAQFRNRYRHRDGSYRWLDWLAVADKSRKLIFASARDITVEKEAEAARIKSQAVLDAVYRSITDHAIYMIDPAGTILTWSLGAESVKGWRSEEVIGKPIEIFYSEEAIAAEQPRRDRAHALAHGSHRSEGWRNHREGIGLDRGDHEPDPWSRGRAARLRERRPRPERDSPTSAGDDLLQRERWKPASASEPPT